MTDIAQALYAEAEVIVQGNPQLQTAMAAISAVLNARDLPPTACDMIKDVVWTMVTVAYVRGELESRNRSAAYSVH